MRDDQTGETRLAEKLIDFVSEKRALQITEKILRLLKEANKSAAALIEEIGFAKFKEEVEIIPSGNFCPASECGINSSRACPTLVD
jgi:dissimilatory sulfite reductase (desulfoviridin) alpha/beta subunit